MIPKWFKVLFLIVLFESVFSDRAEPCDHEKCLLPDCRCSSTEIPGGLSPKDIPQFVVFTFDDAVTISNIDFYRRAFNHRVNPGGCPAAATFFVSHEYTDYSLVNELYRNAHEIALHSISHNASGNYWKNPTEKTLSLEFGGQRQMISTFANIPKDDIRGIRLPFLQMSGERSFEMLEEEGLLYDFSWPTIHHRVPGMWPYTLDYRSSQDCVIGPCPVEAHPNKWVMPMLSWTDSQDIFCSMADTCVNIPESAANLTQFIIDNFNRNYQGNKAPFGFYVHAGWFLSHENAFEAYVNFLDYLQAFPDVVIASATQVLNWVRNPVPLSEIVEDSFCPPRTLPYCSPLACRLMKGNEERWMTLCGNECPRVYPWCGNPLGE